MKTTVSTSSTGLSVTLESAKNHLRLSLGFTDDDEYITNLIRSAESRVEEMTNRKLMPQTWKYYLDEWPSTDNIQLPYSPLRSVPSTGILYTDYNGNSTTMSSTEWSYDSVSEPGRIVLEHNEDWPTVTLHPKNPIEITFNCGYSAQSAIPMRLKQAVLLLVSHWYENREPYIVGQTITHTPDTVDSLISDYRVFDF